MNSPDDSLSRLVRALRRQSLSSLVRNSLSRGDRYIGCVTDEPMVWTMAFADRRTACRSLIRTVAHRQALNGAGEGAVLDLVTKRLVATAGMPMPKLDEIARTVQFIIDCHYRI